MASFLDFLLGNSTNLARSAGAPMAANMPGNIMSRGPYRGLGGTGGINPRGYPPAWSTPPFVPTTAGTPPFNPSPMFRPPLSGRFPRLQSVSQRIGQFMSNMDPLAVGLLAASGPRPVGTSSFGSRLGEAFQFASQAQDARTQR